MALRVLMYKGFAREAKKEGLSLKALCKAVAEIESGLVDARLGGFLLKKRVAKGNRGKSAGFRTILAHRQGDRLICLFLFQKNERDDISEQEHLALSLLGDKYMDCTSTKLDELVDIKELIEVDYNGYNEDEPDSY